MQFIFVNGFLDFWQTMILYMAEMRRWQRAVVKCRLQNVIWPVHTFSFIVTVTAATAAATLGTGVVPLATVPLQPTLEMPTTAGTSTSSQGIRTSDHVLHQSHGEANRTDLNFTIAYRHLFYRSIHIFPRINYENAWWFCIHSHELITRMHDDYAYIPTN